MRWLRLKRSTPMFQYSTEYSPSTSWHQGGPIIDRERISTTERTTYWCADSRGVSPVAGPTVLIAAMRCYVASKLGDEVEIPDVLISTTKEGQ